LALMRRSALTACPAWVIAAVIALAYLIVDPPSADLAAQTYRAGMFERHGFLVWDNAWYGGHHMPGYSVLFPPLAALLGPRVVGALAALAAAWLFERIAAEHFGTRDARVGSIWFAAATGVNLITGRLTFALGVAFALACVLAATHRRPGWASLAAAASTLASPVAGLFLGLGAAAWFLGGGRRPDPTRSAMIRRRDALAIGASAVVPALALAVAFPEGGVHPFVGSSFWPSLIGLGLILVALPREERVLRAGVILYALATIASFLLDTPMGGNVTRLGAIIAGPILACLLWTRSPRLLIALAIPLLYWQWSAPVRDWVRGSGDPSVHAGYYDGVLGFLERDPDAAARTFRVEVPFTANHWESRWVGNRLPLARGWERQLDTKVNGVFYEGVLTAARYRRWLVDNGVRYVALPDVPLDGSAQVEARLVRAGQPYLQPVFRDDHWRVFRVRAPAPLASGAGTLSKLTTDAFQLRATRPGTVLVRVRWTPYWKVTDGDACVRRAPGDWTKVQVRRPGTVRVGIAFSPLRIMATGPRC
jgi:hypothetical protein